MNLWVVNACSIPQIRNASGVISKIAKFFNYSPKCQHFFEHIIDAESPETMKLTDILHRRLRPVHFITKTMEAISTMSMASGLGTPRL